MKLITVAVLLFCSVAFAQGPADAPRADLPVDVPGVSVHLVAGEPAPFESIALSIPEDMRRASEKKDLRTQLAQAKDPAAHLLVSRSTIVLLVIGALALGAAAGAGGVALADATRKH